MVICPIRYDDGARTEDLRLWLDLRGLLFNSPTPLLGFVSGGSASYWVDRFTPLTASDRRGEG